MLRKEWVLTCGTRRKEYNKKNLSDERTIGGTGRLTEKLCDNLQRYYGQAIQDNLGDLDGMVKANKSHTLPQLVY